MNAVFVLLVVATVAASGWLVWQTLRKFQDRKRIEEARAAEFLAQATGAAARKDAAAPVTPAATAPVTAPAPAPSPAAAPPGADIAVQKLLFEAAHKAGEAGEPALAIQLYARLLARFPATTFAEPARAAAAALKKKLSKA